MIFLRSIYNNTKKSITNSPITSIFLIFGLTLSVLIISIATSYIAEHLNAQEERTNAKPPNGCQYNMLWLEGKEGKHVEDVFEGIRSNTGIIVNNLMVSLDDGEINEYAPVSAEWFASDTVWHYPLSEGRYYTAEEIKTGEKVVLIGKSLKKYTYEENDKQYIDIEGQKYNVVGIVGFGEYMSSWDARVFIPLSALPQHVTQEFETCGMNFIIHNKDADFGKDIEMITANAEELFVEPTVSFLGEIQGDNVTEVIMKSYDMIYTVAIVGYVASMVYAINIVVFWNNKRKKEIAVRKVVGYKNRDIVKLLTSEMLGYSFLSYIIALAIQLVLRIFIGNIADYTLHIYPMNVVVGLVMVILTTILVSLLPIKRLLKIQPIEALRK